MAKMNKSGLVKSKLGQMDSKKNASIFGITVMCIYKSPPPHLITLHNSVQLSYVLLVASGTRGLKKVACVP